MFTDTQSYFLALDVFALTALAMAATATPGRTKSERNHYLLALFALVIIRSLALIAHLRFADGSFEFSGEFELLSIYFVIWALRKPSSSYSRALRLYSRAGIIAIPIALALAVWLVVTLPWQPIAALIALGGLPLVFSGKDKSRLTHLSAPVFLGMAALFHWGGLVNLSHFVTLMGYGALMYAVFVESAISARLKQQTVESLAIESQRVHAERLRFMEVGSTLSAAHNPIEMLHHAARTIAQSTRINQVAILAFSPAEPNIGQVVAAFSTDGSIHHTATDQISFNISDIPPVLDVLESQKHLLINNAKDAPEVSKLYALWGEANTGPTLLQPLLLEHKIVGVLVLGNPASGRALPNQDIRLSQTLAPQLASLVLYQNQYYMLETQAEDYAAKYQLLQSRMRQLSDIVEQINDGVIVSDVEGKIHLVNRTAQHILGKSTEQLLGKPIGTVYGDIASDKSIETLATEFSRNNQPLSTHFEHNGRSVQGQVVPLRNNRQEWMGFLVLLRDITTEAAAEKKRRDFMKTISRELRTPLTTSRGFTDLVFAGTEPVPTLQQTHFLDIVRSGLDRVIEIVNNATQMVDYDTQTLTLDLKPVDVQALILSAVQSASSSAPASDQTQYLTDIAPDLPLIQADPVKLRHAMDILLFNARQMSKKQGLVSLHAWMQSEGLNGQAKKHLIISVADSGGDQSETRKKRSFEPSPDRGDELGWMVDGTNLQLPKVKEIIEAHGGRVWVEAIEGAGGVYHITLPYSSNK